MADDILTPKERVIDFREVGATGLRRFSGFIFEEFLANLLQWKGAAIYKEMSWNDATIGACLYAIEMLIRKCEWSVKSASNQPFDLEAADFLDSCRSDMSVTWPDLINEITHETIVYGYCIEELVYKRRCGDVFDPSMRSKHQDGRIGWRKISVRSTDTIYRWQFDDHGGLQGVEQLAPPHYYHVTIPVEKFLIFRTRIMKNNPEGRSLLRGCYRDWYMKKNIENIEAIGIERDLAGLPVALVPPELLSSSASAIEKQNLQEIKNIVTNIRRDEQEGIVFPRILDANGKDMYELKLLSTGGQRQFDTDKIIHRYDMRIARTFLADFLLIGQEKVGTSSMVGSRQDLFGTALMGFLDIITDVFNNYAVPRLFALNDFQISDYPKLVHGDMGAVDLKELAAYITALSGSGMPLFPDTNLENFLLRAGGMPERADLANDPDLDVEPVGNDKPSKEIEIPALPVQTPTGLQKPSDTTPINDKPPVNQVATNISGNTEITSAMHNRQAFNQPYHPGLGPQS
jgi:hypothetical protein